MIKINIERDHDTIKKITISGHSGYAAQGQDIVCAGISAVSEGSVNAITEITKKKPTFEIKDGFLSIEYRADAQTQLIAKVTYVQLKSVAESYPENVQIIEK